MGSWDVEAYAALVLSRTVVVIVGVPLSSSLGASISLSFFPSTLAASMMAEIDHHFAFSSTETTQSCSGEACSG